MEHIPVTYSSTVPEHIPVTEASARGIARLAKDAEAGHPVIITRHGKPVAAVVPIGSDDVSNLKSRINGNDLSITTTPAASPTPQSRVNRTSATERWVQAVTGSGRSVPGPPAGS